jgi:cell division FtsZ-interacting protein ZapD
MQAVFFLCRRGVAAWLLIVVLLAPAALASDATGDASLWDEFVAWVQSRLDVPGGATAADETGFTAWLMSRFGIPGG